MRTSLSNEFFQKKKRKENETDYYSIPFLSGLVMETIYIIQLFDDLIFAPSKERLAPKSDC